MTLTQYAHQWELIYTICQLYVHQGGGPQRRVLHRVERDPGHPREVQEDNVRARGVLRPRRIDSGQHIKVTYTVSQIPNFEKGTY